MMENNQIPARETEQPPANASIAPKACKKCSLCHGTGHNRRTCPRKKEIGELSTVF
jgi:hypothetical protein